MSQADVRALLQAAYRIDALLHDGPPTQTLQVNPPSLPRTNHVRPQTGVQPFLGEAYRLDELPLDATPTQALPVAINPPLPPPAKFPSPNSIGTITF